MKDEGITIIIYGLQEGGICLQGISNRLRHSILSNFQI